MRSRPSPIQRLRLCVDCLPVRTREAMLDGLQRNDIIVGAYTTRDGVCPMLAAHRAGGRTNLLSFARAWDRFTQAGRRPRRASERELRILRFELQASLLAEETVDLGAVIAEYRAGRPPRQEATAGPLGRSRRGDPDRSAELAKQPGWAWLRPLRRLDDYERALAALEAGGEFLQPPGDPRGDPGATVSPEGPRSLAQA